MRWKEKRLNVILVPSRNTEFLHNQWTTPEIRGLVISKLLQTSVRRHPILPKGSILIPLSRAQLILLSRLHLVSFASLQIF
jgi:hypothetical protein